MVIQREWVSALGITPEAAKDLFTKDLQSRVKEPNDLFETINVDLKHQEFDAIVSFVFNIGIGNIIDRSDMWKIIKSGKTAAVELKNFLSWVRSNGKVLEGLIKRRYDEWDVWSDSEYTRQDRDVGLLLLQCA